ncbi:MAG: T9SS type A sorting domain-containing protein [Bacteroidia bacterium]
MTRIFTLILFIVFTTQGFSQAQWIWAKQLGGRNNTSGGAFLGRDNTGSLYMAGDFTGTRSFGTTNLTAVGSSDLFIAKLDTAGNVTWVEKASGANNTTYIDVRAAYTTPAGETYITGKFNGTVTFGTTPLTSTSAFDDMYIACYSSTGSLNYAIRFGGSGGGAGVTEGRGIYADGSGKVYVTGAFSSTVSFGSTTVTAAHQFNSDIFVLKMTGSTVDWAVRAGSATQEDKGNAITADASGNVYVAGMYKQSSDFGSITLTSTGVKDMFIARYSPAGVIDWAIRAGGTSSSQPNNSPAAEANAIKLDQNNNIYVTGIMNGNNVNFGTGVSLNEQQQQGAFYGDFFVAKYNSSGTVQWARNGGGNSVTDSGNALDVDAAGNVYVTGSFQGNNANFNGLTVSSAGFGDVFVLKYTSTGTIAWINKIGAGNEDIGLSIIVDGTNKAYVSGFFTGNINVGASTINSPAGSWQIFLARMDAGNTSVNELSSLPFDLYPNPANEVLFINGNDLKYVEITDQLGRIVYHSELNNLKSNLDLSGLDKGIYFISVTDGKATGTKKLVVN